MISTAELFGRAGVVDVRRGQDCAIFLVVTQVTILETITDLVPLDAF